jgi:uncharacterized protein
MIKRDVEIEVKRLAKQYPVLTIVGPRQSGKTTLTQVVFPNYSYVNLENLSDKNHAIQDPSGFFKKYKPPVIIDEIQKAPQLLSQVQVVADQLKQNGKIILTGSQQFELRQSLSQSLAGRTALIELLPLSIRELEKAFPKKYTLEDYLFNGFYPRIYNENLEPTEAYSFYVSTYLERDIRNLINVKDYLLFDRFIKICASRTGQILNLSSIGNECGVSHNTINSWISLLEASYIVYRVQPHFRNYSKRLIKSPKLYFYDVGLACFLLGIENSSQLKNHPLKGSLFETLVISELIKFRFNKIRKSNLYYFRDNTGHEIDILIDQGAWCNPVEIKLSETLNPDFLKGIDFYQKLQNSKASKSALIYGGNDSYSFKETQVLSFDEAFRAFEL